MTYALDTRDGYVRRMIAVGRRLGIAPRGIVVGIATGLVESQIKVYANPKVPESMRLPHDAVGMDGRSVGVLQQQVVSTANGWWWGTAEQCMNPETSFAMFFERLAKRDYMRGDAGDHAQAVQGSAFPDRYGQRMAEAQQLYDRLAQKEVPSMAPKYTELDYMTGGGRSTRSRPPVNFLLHTEEGNSSARDLAVYCNGAHDVSYHYTVRDRIVCDVVDTDYASWSVLSANAFTINLCFAGSRASWSRSQWLGRADDIEIAAWLAVQDCRKYSIPTTVIAPDKNGDYRRSSGISDHRYVTEALGIGTHHDVGDGFPWDVFAGHVRRFTNPDFEEIDMAAAKDLEKKLDLILDQIGPKLPSWGPQSSYGLDEHGRERTQRDGLIARFDAVERRLDAIEKAVTK